MEEAVVPREDAELKLPDFCKVFRKRNEKLL